MMKDALHSKEQYQHIRAVPLRGGEAVVFSHRIIHWGSRGRAGGAAHVRSFFRQRFTLENAIEFHAFAPLEASRRVTNGIHLHFSNRFTL
jgi:hypothetical protein